MDKYQTACLPEWKKADRIWDSRPDNGGAGYAAWLSNVAVRNRPKPTGEWSRNAWSADVSPEPPGNSACAYGRYILTANYFLNCIIIYLTAFPWLFINDRESVSLRAIRPGDQRLLLPDIYFYYIAFPPDCQVPVWKSTRQPRTQNEKAVDRVKSDKTKSPQHNLFQWYLVPADWQIRHGDV